MLPQRLVAARHWRSNQARVAAAPHPRPGRPLLWRRRQPLPPLWATVAHPDKSAPPAPLAYVAVKRVLRAALVSAPASLELLVLLVLLAPLHLEQRPQEEAALLTSLSRSPALRLRGRRQLQRCRPLLWALLCSCVSHLGNTSLRAARVGATLRRGLSPHDARLPHPGRLRPAPALAVAPRARLGPQVMAAATSDHCPSASVQSPVQCNRPPVCRICCTALEASAAELAEAALAVCSEVAPAARFAELHRRG